MYPQLGPSSAQSEMSKDLRNMGTVAISALKVSILETYGTEMTMDCLEMPLYRMPNFYLPTCRELRSCYDQLLRELHSRGR